tara:strand:- start:4853 stop:5254 length:402 start_codon:yes stop_codon:yes gene_type:complete
VKIYILLPFFLNLAISSDSKSLFDIDVRLRVVNDDMLYVVVQVDNFSGRGITELEGFITESNSDDFIVSQKKIVHIHPYDPILTNGQMSIRGYNYKFNKSMDHNFRYHISRLTFRNDNRVFAWSPFGGLIRIK